MEDVEQPYLWENLRDAFGQKNTGRVEVMESPESSATESLRGLYLNLRFFVIARISQRFPKK